MLEKSFGLFFFLKQPKNQKENSERYVYLRVTVDGIPKELSTKRIWNHNRWDQATGRAKGSKEDALQLNAYLDILRANAYTVKSKLLLEGKTITSELIKNALTGKGDEKKMLCEIFSNHNNTIKELVGKDYSYKTLQKYKTTLSHTTEFIKWKFAANDIDLQELNYAFVKDFSFWLKTIKNCNHNSTMKYISTLKSITIECRKKKWLNQDPFCDFKTAYREVEIVPLYADELATIMNKNFSMDRLNLVKDIFIFSCYTGLAYVDVGNLKRSQILNGVDGEKWIITKRQKTDAPQRVPLLKPALEIIDKYANHSKCQEKGFVLPVLTNQKMNAYLKEIADICGISKNLTFHIARHTFATTVTLSNGVPIETVSKMLGHKNLKQTQHYAKILDRKISEDMAALKSKLSAIK